MLGDLYKDKNDKFWIEIGFNDGKCNSLEGSSDLSSQFDLPPLTVMESGDSEFINIDEDNKEYLKSLELQKVEQGYKMTEEFHTCSSGDWVYVKKYIVMNEFMKRIKKIKTVEDARRFSVFNEKVKNML